MYLYSTVPKFRIIPVTNLYINYDSYNLDTVTEFVLFYSKDFRDRT